jgi:hypothetical protein
MRGDLPAAITLWQTVVDQQQASGLIARAFLSLAAFLQGDWPAAAAEATAVQTAAERSGEGDAVNLATAVLGLLAVGAGDYPRAVEILSSPQLDGMGMRSFSRWGLALAAAGSGDAAAVETHLTAGLTRAAAMGSPAWQAFYLPAAAWRQHQQGDSTTAASLIGLAYHHPASVTGWLDALPVSTDLQMALADTLGAAGYAEAQAAGRDHDLTDALGAWLS